MGHYLEILFNVIVFTLLLGVMGSFPSTRDPPKQLPEQPGGVAA